MTTTLTVHTAGAPGHGHQEVGPDGVTADTGHVVQECADCGMVLAGYDLANLVVPDGADPADYEPQLYPEAAHIVVNGDARFLLHPDDVQAYMGTEVQRQDPASGEWYVYQPCTPPT